MKIVCQTCGFGLDFDLQLFPPLNHSASVKKTLERFKIKYKERNGHFKAEALISVQRNFFWLVLDML